MLIEKSSFFLGGAKKNNGKKKKYKYKTAKKVQFT